VLIPLTPALSHLIKLITRQFLGRAGRELDFAPNLTSPVDGGGTATPSPSMGRAGVGAENTQKVSCNEPSQEGRGRKEWGIPRLPIRRANRHLEANGYP